MRLYRAPPLRSLRAFCVAARYRSFKVAADDLFLTPSAVSHQMKELERALGVPLFERKTRSLELTGAGQALLTEVEPLLAALDRSVTQIARRGNRRRLHLVAPPFFATELLVPRLAGFCKSFPQIDLCVDTGDPRPTAHPPAADASILLANEPPLGLKTVELFPVELVAACAPDHVEAVARLGHRVFDELALIVQKTRPSAWSDWALEAGLERPEPNNLLEVDSMAAAVRAAEAGLGIALVPETLCSRTFAAGFLVRVFAIRLRLAESYYLACRTKDAQRAEVAALLDWVAEEFRADRQIAPSYELLAVATG